ncbi:hypothetical protein F5B22DRAFT_655854 [Xylaria bambusicola]|uniref:uncharacterized protein n=1 Tax=Xylaria bambusicola TaxID=326684 RepID=UPI002007C423|nr:uncharacterized protein F5B22DRAFT_655854 [Xylaria bambusicola]KAI0516690.1 hypothetical protein F5B22DRAFT_655854 [Xylaria bambusicola]
MRLLKALEDGQLTLTKDLTSNIPPYAILLIRGDITKDTAKHKNGYKKIEFCAQKATSDSLAYFWVDSCCIDKSNNTELTTAINSMFKWYQNAAKCYVYLSDVSCSRLRRRDDAWKSAFRHSKWFTRGWTLQELIAPSVLTHRRLIHQLTGISGPALRGAPLSEFSRRERLLWAEGRITKLEEDRAYSLIGLFEISLPLVYGEGVKLAFRRLEEEIDKQEAFERRDRLPDHRSCSVSSSPFKAKERMEPCLQSLLFPEMNTRRLSVENPADETCLWLFSHQLYQDWFIGKGENLIFLKGKPGAGKSTLMKEAFRRALLERHDSEDRVAAFFFNGKAGPLEKSALGLYRSVLYQLLPGNQDLERFCTLWEEKFSGYYNNEQKGGTWNTVELQNFFSSMFRHRRTKRTIIFIDALDECKEKNIQRIVGFWERVTDQASYTAARLSVCISIRDFPGITASGSEAIIVQNNNSHDITTYVEQKFMRSIAAEEPQWKLLKDGILYKSSGVFLWVVLVVDDLLKRRNDGGSIQYLLKQLDTVPDQLQHLFSPVKPLRLYEWHHILAFIRKPPPLSLQEWRESDHFTRDDNQLEKKIKSLSRGLLEILTSNDDVHDESLETISDCAGAGSLSLGSGETRIVQVIHESVREFFLKMRGFSTLDQENRRKPHHTLQGHISIMTTCLDYINIKELDTLVQALNRANKQRNEAADVKEFLEKQDENMACAPQKHEFYTKAQAQDSSCSGAKHRRHKIALDRQDGQRKMQTSITKLTKSVSQHKFTEISQWLELLPAGKWSDDTALVNKSSLNPFPTPSVTNRSEVLEHHPALLSYALYEFPSHAKRAGRQLPEDIAKRLQQGAELDRWITLREDSTLVRDYIFPPEPNSRFMMLQTLEGFLERQSISSASEGQKDQKARSWSSSVASFSSASSHRGSLA